MDEKQTHPGTLRSRKERALKLPPLERERELAALEAERQALILSVYNWVWNRVNVFCKRYGIPFQERGDLAQAAFMRVVLGAETYDSAKGKPSTYFSRAAWDGMMGWLRDHKRDCERTTLSLDWNDGDDDQRDTWQAYEPEEPLYEFDELEQLGAALKRLPARQRSILRDRMAGRSFSAIAADHGISKVWVYELQCLALATLRQWFADPTATRRSAAARKGARGLHAQNKAHRFSSEQAREAGAKGGKARKTRRTRVDS